VSGSADADLSLQACAQPFVSAGVYRDYKELVLAY
jgi:hypothetical protein